MKELWLRIRTRIVTWLIDFCIDPGEDASAPAEPTPTLPPNVPPESPPTPPKPAPEPPKPAEPHPPAPAPRVSLLEPFCLAIQTHEGFFKPGQNPKYPNGTRAWRNNNPGNLKNGPFAKMCGGIGQDEKGFAVFPSYEKGFEALKTLVRNAATGVSTVYKPTMSFLQFFQTYAPSSDHNDPVSYAKAAAKKLGVDYQNYQIKNLV